MLGEGCLTWGTLIVAVVPHNTMIFQYLLSRHRCRSMSHVARWAMSVMVFYVAMGALAAPCLYALDLTTGKDK